MPQSAEIDTHPLHIGLMDKSLLIVVFIPQLIFVYMQFAGHVLSPPGEQPAGHQTYPLLFLISSFFA